MEGYGITKKRLAAEGAGAVIIFGDSTYASRSGRVKVAGTADPSGMPRS